MSAARLARLIQWRRDGWLSLPAGPVPTGLTDGVRVVPSITIEDRARSARLAGASMLDPDRSGPAENASSSSVESPNDTSSGGESFVSEANSRCKSVASANSNCSGGAPPIGDRAVMSSAEGIVERDRRHPTRVEADGRQWPTHVRRY